MASDLDFKADEFMAMTPARRVQLCRKLAERAKALAAAAEPPHQPYYLTIAHEWLNLATEMEQAIAEDAKTA